jgi:hypothetical protein
MALLQKADRIHIFECSSSEPANEPLDGTRAMGSAAQSESLAERARAIYERQLSQILEAEHPNEFVAIEPESGNYYLAPTLSEAIQAARRAFPDRMPFAMRVGHRTAVQIGMGAS